MSKILTDSKLIYRKNKKMGSTFSEINFFCHHMVWWHFFWKFQNTCFVVLTCSPETGGPGKVYNQSKTPSKFGRVCRLKKFVNLGFLTIFDNFFRREIRPNFEGVLHWFYTFPRLLVSSAHVSSTKHVFFKKVNKNVNIPQIKRRFFSWKSWSHFFVFFCEAKVCKFEKICCHYGINVMKNDLCTEQAMQTLLVQNAEVCPCSFSLGVFKFAWKPSFRTFVFEQKWLAYFLSKMASRFIWAINKFATAFPLPELQFCGVFSPTTTFPFEPACQTWKAQISLLFFTLMVQGFLLA